MSHQPPDIEAELSAAIQRIVNSRSPKKLIVAGPGTGKTSLFRKLLEATPGDRNSRLVLTFINNLKNDLERDLSVLARVSTLHGYCQSLMHLHRGLCPGLTADFECLPGLRSLIEKDWEYSHGSPSPPFVGYMRNLEHADDVAFYLSRGNYYDAIDFDDSVYRVYQGATDRPDVLCSYNLILIDEFQDFNPMEAAFIEMLANQSPIVIVGDDDQALYSQLRGSSWEFIRSLYHGEEYEGFELPFCMRCPEVIVGAVNDIVVKARQLRKLNGRIEKPFRHYAPVKGADSQRYPQIGRVMTTVQRLNANYFGRYIESAIKAIPQEEIDEASQKGFPAVLVIGGKQYLSQISNYLTNHGCPVDAKKDGETKLEKETGLRILKENPDSNLGWRVILEFENQKVAAATIRKTIGGAIPLVETIPPDLRNRILADAERLAAQSEDQSEVPLTTEANGPARPFIKLTSFEGAKGLSAQHVFIVGMHAGELPHDATSIKDLEICKFIVGLTRTRKRCSLLYTKSFANEFKQPSVFLSWIKRDKYQLTEVNAAYWERAQT